MSANRIILDLCGGTGAWGKPYKDAGYDVRLVTLPDGDVTTYTPPPGVYGILAAPPCDRFSIASRKNNTDPDFLSGLVVVRACLDIIWNCQLEGSLKFWALENPVGHLRKFLGRPQFTFEQWQYGDRLCKPTDIWGYFNVPKRIGGTKPPPPGTSSYRCSRNPVIRAKTPPGFARAFFLANQ